MDDLIGVLLTLGIIAFALWPTKAQREAYRYAKFRAITRELECAIQEPVRVLLDRPRKEED